MYAIVEIAGQQFKVVKDQKVFVHRLQTEEGKKVNFDNVLLLNDGDKVTVGAPAIGGAQVSAKVLKHLKGDKVIVFKKKRRKGYRVKNGHRQSLTEIQIESILASGAKKVTKAESEGAKKAAPAKATKAAAPKATALKVETKKATPKAKVETKPAAKKETATQDLSKMTVAELKEMAKAKGITGISSMKKADLIAALS
ncbi:MAG: 50S ribosomal protein L21 [Chlorobi bacterium]|nr:50S ribosomal protein L21 [Chlorobiota bacterium]